MKYFIALLFLSGCSPNPNPTLDDCQEILFNTGFTPSTCSHYYQPAPEPGPSPSPKPRIITKPRHGPQCRPGKRCPRTAGK